ncbi:hypothetical protein RUM43_002085 [Polyplax serrata]|uniref:Origin recognition complex subunit 3 n=1 Tax=Polyplax serrata TaxID=468196 RepID=A0AAN8PC35_POLSC
MQTNSVSQGSFLFLPKNFSLTKLRRSKKRKLNAEEEKNWNIAFQKVWNVIDKEVKEINDQLFKKVLEGLLKHIQSLHKEIKFDEGVLPCEILLTGTNLPDHNLLVSALTDNIKEVTPYFSSEQSDVEDADSDADDDPSSKITLQVSQCNMATLCAWYFSRVKVNNSKHPVVIFIPDFESFSPKVLSEFVYILSSYSSQVPFVLIFGVATTPGAVYQTLPHNALSQLNIQLFKSETSVSFLNNVVEKILFSEKCPFRLGVQGFIQGFKFCMMEHFFNKNHYSLCCSMDDLDKHVKQLKDDDIEGIRRIPSFQKFVEGSSKDDRVLLLLNNDHTKKVVKQMICDVQEYMNNFHVALKCLHIITQDLPQYPLGRHLREYYCNAVSTDVRESSQYKESMKMLRFQSRNELTVKISLMVELLKLNSLFDILSLDRNTKFEDICCQLEQYKKNFDRLGENSGIPDGGTSEFEEMKKSFLDYIETKIFDEMLLPVVTKPLHEIILFDDLPAVRRRISGSPRGAIHLALNNPQYYLECNCCTLPHAEAVLPTLPDLSIVYKLHLEFGKVINLYDWLQAFAACVKPDQTESETQADEELQARFTRAVSELQFLGFIKPSRTKSDYVNRLTWGTA